MTEARAQIMKRIYEQGFMNTEQLANFIGVSNTSMQAWLRGDYKPRYKAFCLLARTLHYNPYTLEKLLDECKKISKE